MGASSSTGAYLQPAAEDVATFPAQATAGDFWQTTVALDASYAWRHWQIWSEWFVSRFEVPNVGDADSLAYFIEARYKITPQLFAALRWNQQFFGEVRDLPGALTPWDRDTSRIDAALGFRFNRHWQTKVQYSFAHKNGSPQQGQQLVAAQLTLKF